LIVYLDTSNLVKLYVHEEGSDEVRALLDRAAVAATSVIAYAEAGSAFARRCRDRSLTPAEHEKIKAAFDFDWPHLLTLDVTRELAQLAGEIADSHALRGFDGLHLACYLTLQAQVPDQVVEFSSFDDALNAAALAAAV
jgi:predicted nucleic acid-binding protein